MVAAYQWIVDAGKLLGYFSIILVPALILTLVSRFTKLKRYKICRILAYPRKEWSRLNLEEELDNPGFQGSTDVIASTASEVSVNDGLPLMKEEEEPQKINWVRGAIIVFGFLIALLSNNYFQEKIMNTKYDIGGDGSSLLTADKNSTNGTTINFSDAQFLLLCNRSIGLVLPFLIMAVFRFYERMKNVENTKMPLFYAPYYVFALTAPMALFANWALLEALLYIDFPLQIIAQAARIVPMMAIGQLFERKHYKWFEYLLFTFIIGSAAGFLYQYASNNKSTSVQSPSMANGLPLLVVFWISDAADVNYLSQIFVKLNPTALEAMGIENFWAVLLLGVSCGVAGTLPDNFKLMAQSMQLTMDIWLQSFCFTMIQLTCLFAVIDLKPVGAAIMGTMGLVLSLVSSSLFYGHYLSPLAIVSVVFLFGFIFLHTYLKSRT